MELSHSLSMRPEQRQLLTPRMIQSMEILQLPLAALEERIEQELQNNPVLEIREADGSEAPDGVEITTEIDSARDDYAEGEQALVLKEGNDAADFDRLEKLSEYLESDEFTANANRDNYRQAASYDGERDKKMDALNNTAARGETLAEHLLGQWAFIETTPAVRKAGEAIINYIDPEGYFRADFETVLKESKTPLKMEDL